MMDRRRFLQAIPAAVLVTPLATAAQEQGKVYRIGWLGNLPPTAPEVAPLWPALIDGLRERGWVEGKNYLFERRYAEGRPERFAAFAAELVQANVDLIVGTGTLGTTAAKGATSTIPIVMFNVGDPVASGLVTSLASPGGNVTGLAHADVGVNIKALDLLKQLLPGARIAVLHNPTMPLHPLVLRDLRAVAATSGVELVEFAYRAAADLAPAFSTIAEARLPAVLMLGHPLVFIRRAEIAALALKHRLATISPYEEAVDAGTLMSYGERLIDEFRRLPYFIDKILRGTKPADLPVEQPTHFYLVINLRTAKALGIAIPFALLNQADRVIE